MIGQVKVGVYWNNAKKFMALQYTVVHVVGSYETWARQLARNEAFTQSLLYWARPEVLDRDGEWVDREELGFLHTCITTAWNIR